MSQSRKRQLLKEFDNIAEIKELQSSAVVHGYVTNLSPKKPKHFDGTVADGHGGQMRFVSFENRQREAFEGFLKEKTAGRIEEL